MSANNRQNGCTSSLKRRAPTSVSWRAMVAKSWELSSRTRPFQSKRFGICFKLAASASLPQQLCPGICPADITDFVPDCIITTKQDAVEELRIG
eukprot:3512333-Rhodomonas_salina.2